MKYNASHKREAIGGQVHETMAEKKKRKMEYMEENLEQIDSSLSKMRKDLERENVESEYLVPEIKNWIETGSVKSVKERVKSWISLKYPVHIIGPTGCGKTILALQAAKEFGRPVVWINGDESVTTTDLIGGYSQVETSTIRDKYIHNVFKDKDIMQAQWVDNPLTLACKYGYTLIYNEFSRSRAVANNVLLSIFSEGILELPTQFGEERYVKVHPEFRAIFTSNSIEYAGVHNAQDALLDRMVGIYMDYYDRETEAKIIAAHSGINEQNALLIAELVGALRKKSPEGFCLGTRAGVMVAQALALKNNFDKPSIKQMLADVITSKTKNKAHYEKQMQSIEKL
ncbi:MAG: gas vesicle protein GvpN [Nanoarchaeota archaeon]|nr:gas vesicle protein GvpN [Nanoarchaeota archaeon]